MNPNTSNGLSTRALGDSFGEETHTLTVAEMPSHNHVPSAAQNSHIVSFNTAGTWGLTASPPSTAQRVTDNDPNAAMPASGGDDAHNIMQPSAGGPPAAELLAHVAKVGQARSLARRSDPESVALWSSLVGGRVSLVPRTNGSRSEYWLLENPHETRSFRALAPQEASALLLATQGISNKLVAYGLGVAPSVASTLLARAAAKMGLASRAELLRVAALIARDERSDMTEAVLTAAEREILSLLETGLTNEGIAKRRSRSVRTIANQVASLLRKTGAASRRELLVRSARRRVGAPA